MLTKREVLEHEMNHLKVEALLLQASQKLAHEFDMDCYELSQELNVLIEKFQQKSYIEEYPENPLCNGISFSDEAEKEAEEMIRGGDLKEQYLD